MPDHSRVHDLLTLCCFEPFLALRLNTLKWMLATLEVLSFSLPPTAAPARDVKRNAIVADQEREPATERSALCLIADQNFSVRVTLLQDLLVLCIAFGVAYLLRTLLVHFEFFNERLPGIYPFSHYIPLLLGCWRCGASPATWERFIAIWN